MSHSLDEVFGLADRIAVLYQGELVAVADPDDVNEGVLSNLIANGRRDG